MPATKRLKVVPSNPLKADPSRTTTLRRKAMAEVFKRFDRLKGMLLRLIEEEDAFGLKQENKLDRGLSLNTRWKFQTNDEQLKSFRQWLADNVDATVLQGGESNAWMDKYIQESYEKGAGRAFDESQKRFAAGQGEFFDGKKAQFLSDAFRHPASVERVKLLASRAFTDLKNVTEAMSQQLSRVLVDGLIQGQSPRTIARLINKDVDKIGRTRALTIARTEIVRAHAEGQLDGLELLGVKEVGVAVEWSTAGDDRVCPLCQPLEGIVMKIKEARGTLPRHPNCVLGDTRILAPDSMAIMRAKYSGEVFEILTENSRLSVTPHHILLTKRGWVFAKDITDSDYLVYCFNADRLTRTIDKNKTYPSISNMFASLVEVVKEGRITVALPMPRYFHGDGQSLNQEIQIISTEGILGDKSQPSLSKGVETFFNGGAISTLHPFGFYRKSSLSTFLETTSTTTDSLMGSLGITGVLIARAVLHHETISSGIISDGYSQPNEGTSYSPATNSKLLTKRIDTSVAQVEFDQLVNQYLVPVKGVKSRHMYDLPVYDVSTESTAYIANGIITSNCRCAYIPANVGEDTKGQLRSKAKIDKAVEKSVLRETSKRRRDGTTRTVEERKDSSKWVGADKTFRHQRGRRFTKREVDKILDTDPIPKIKTPALIDASDLLQVVDADAELNGLVAKGEKTVAKATKQIEDLESRAATLNKEADDLYSTWITSIKKYNEEVRKGDFSLPPPHYSKTPEGDVMFKAMQANDAEVIQVARKIDRAKEGLDRKILKVFELPEEERMTMVSHTVDTFHAKTRTEIKSFEKKMGKANRFLSRFIKKTDSPIFTEGKILPPGERAFFRFSENAANMTVKNDVAVYVHEIVHGVEAKLPGALKRSKEFAKRRIQEAGSKTVKLAEKFPDWGFSSLEEGNPDSWEKLYPVDHAHAFYVGKDYSDATEVLTMGTELLFRDATNFFQKDPQFFKFIIGSLRGKF